MSNVAAPSGKLRRACVGAGERLDVCKYLLLARLFGEFFILLGRPRSITRLVGGVRGISRIPDALLPQNIKGKKEQAGLGQLLGFPFRVRKGLPPNLFNHKVR